MKKCKECDTEKPKTEFYKHFFNEDRLSGSCKKCDKNKVLNRYKTKIGLITHIYSNQKLNSKLRKHPLPTYSKKEFTNWMLSQKNFNVLFDEWSNNNYDRKLTPSVDRLDDYKGYSFDNIRLVTWNENMSKSHSDIKNGINRKGTISVIQYSLAGDFIKLFYSISQAGRENSINGSSISNGCKRQSKQACGYIWNYK